MVGRLVLYYAKHKLPHSLTPSPMQHLSMAHGVAGPPVQVLVDLELGHDTVTVSISSAITTESRYVLATAEIAQVSSIREEEPW